MLVLAVIKPNFVNKPNLFAHTQEDVLYVKVAMDIFLSCPVGRKPRVNK